MQKGFFSKKEIESKTRPGGKVMDCTSCGLFQKCTSPKMEPYGNFKKGIMNIGEAPGETEDDRGKPFQGKAGRLLQKTYKELGIDLFEDCININAVNCRPSDEVGRNRAPSRLELDYCRVVKVLKAIEKYKPKVIILLGNSPLYSIIGHRWKKDLDTISRWRGFTIPDQDFKAWVCPTFHPSHIMRSVDALNNYNNQTDSSVEKVIWIEDLKRAFERLKDPFPIWKEPTIEIISDLRELEYTVCHSEWGDTKVHLRPQFIVFDYETTGLKPYADGHRIVCASVADTRDHAYVFMMPETRAERKPFTDLLTDPQVGKVAQNMKFEDTWTHVRLKTEIRGWWWDTMQATHILDNRPLITGLKFMNYVIFGIVDYDSEVAPYLKSKDEKNANSINQIYDLLKLPGGKEKLLTYCGWDSIVEYRLYEWQQQFFLPF